MHFMDLLKKYMDEKAALAVTFGDNFSINCRILEVFQDYIKINQLSFNKAERAYNPTPHYYYVPVHSIVFLEEPRAK